MPATAAATATKEEPATRFAKDQLKAFIERIERLEEENHRLLDELARLRGEFARLTVAEAPKQASAHLLFVPTPERYLLVEREGAPPARGEELQVFEVEGRFTVTKVGRAPYPGELRPCAYLLRLA